MHQVQFLKFCSDLPSVVAPVLCRNSVCASGYGLVSVIFITLQYDYNDNLQICIGGTFEQ